MAQHGAGTIVTSLDADGLLEAFHRLYVVVVNVGFGIEHGVDGLEATFEIGHQHFDGGVGVFVTDRADGGGPDGGSPVGELIAGDGRYHTVLKIHLGHGIGHSGWFGDIVFSGPAGLDRAEITRAGADIAQNHHRGGAARPTFP